MNGLHSGLRAALLAAALLGTLKSAAASSPDLTALSLEDLLAAEVYSVSKKAEKRFAAAAAVSAITHLLLEDVERIEVALVGQNLLDSHQPEFRTELVDAVSSEFERGFYSAIRWTF